MGIFQRPEFSGDEWESDTIHHAQNSGSVDDAHVHGVEDGDGCARGGYNDGASHADHNIMEMQSQHYFAALLAVTGNRSALRKPERQ